MERTLCVWFPDWPLRRPDVPSAEPCQAVDGGNLVFSWRREGGKHLYRVEAPAGYRIVLVREETPIPGAATR